MRHTTDTLIVYLPCPTCKGDGRIIHEPCQTCNGSGAAIKK